MLVLDESLTLPSLKNFRIDKELCISASAQFSERSFSEILPSLTGNIIVVDLRQESHGFIKGIPVSWYFEENKSNEGVTVEALEAREEQQLRTLALEDKVLVHSILEKTKGVITRSQSHQLALEEIETEKALVTRLGLSYYRLPILDHHRPQEGVANEFISFVKNLPKDAWLHAHCRGGKGRSTTFMVLYAILRNNKKISLEEIVERQVRLGGSDVLSLSQSQEKAWKREAAIERKRFIEDFYQKKHPIF